MIHSGEFCGQSSKIAGLAGCFYYQSCCPSEPRVTPKIGQNFQRDQAQYQGKNAVVLGVSVDSANSHKQFCAREGLNFKLLADTDYKVTTEYGSLTNMGAAKFAARHTFIINPDGKIA